MPRRKKIDRDLEPNEFQKAFEEASSAARSAGFADRLPPMRLADGKPNPKFYSEFLTVAWETVLACVSENREVPFNIGQLQTGVLTAAKFAGLDAESVLDDRPIEEKAATACYDLITSPESIWWQEDEVLQKILEMMDRADTLGKEYFDKRSRDRASRKAEAILEGKDRWRTRINLVLRLRERARTPKPNGLKNNVGYGTEAVWPLRLMVYCGRAGVAVGGTQDPVDKVFIIGPHHAKMACDVWEAQHGAYYNNEGELDLGVFPYTGAVIVAPPGHGKSEFGIHWCASELVRDPSHCFLIGHAQAEVAQRNLAQVRSLFDATLPQGRRFISLFGLELDPDESSARRFRIRRVGDGGGRSAPGRRAKRTSERSKAPTMAAYGATSRISGVDATRIWFDDMVDQNVIDEETVRRRTYDRIHGTWLARKRGVKAFDLTTTTLWHPDDANMRRITAARNGDEALRVSIQSCGGPKTTPKFRSLFPEIYDARWLQAKYNAMRNPRLYACCYMSDPMAEDDRPIDRLVFFDPSSAEHQTFLRNARYILSLDPAGTNKITSDPAGIAVIAVGNINVRKHDERGEYVETVKVARVLEAHEIRYNQVELFKFVGEFAQKRTVDEVYVEVKSGYAATADMIEEYYGVNVHRCEPGRRAKDARFKGVAGLMDGGVADVGGPDAVVQFMGVGTEEGAAADPACEWVYEQFLHFGSTKADHVVDAVVQVIERISDELHAGGEGIVSRAVRQRMFNPDADPRLLAEYKRINSPPAEAGEDADWYILN